MIRTPALAAALLLGVASGVPAAAQRVLLIDLDDVGPQLWAGTSTPVLDGAAAAGRRFTRFYTAPSCTPTRARMNLGVRGSHPLVLCGSIVHGADGYVLPCEPLEPLARAVATAGRTTAKVGKWHLAPNHLREHPRYAGWLHYAGVLGNLSGGARAYYEYNKTVDGEVAPVSGHYLTTDETDDALACVLEGVDLVSLSYHAVHVPYHLPPRELYPGAAPLTKAGKARAALMALDTELGRLLPVALAAGYTVLLFSDNGTDPQLGGYKGTVWERGVRMPLIALGAGVVPGVDEGLVAVEDVYATVLELLDVPGGPTRGPHSVSFANRLTGGQGGSGVGRPWIYTEVWAPNGADPRWEPTLRPWRRGIRDARYKLVRDQDWAGDRLYDLALDPLEQEDLLESGDPPEPAWGAYLTLRSVLDGM